MALTTYTSTANYDDMETIERGSTGVTHLCVGFSQDDDEQEIVAAPGAGKKIVVLALFHAANTSKSWFIKSGITQVMRVDFKTNSPWSMPLNRYGWFCCGENEALNWDFGTNDHSGTINLVYAIIPS